MIALSAIWSFLKSPIGRWVCLAILVGGMLFAVRAEGYKAGEGAEKAAEAKRVAKAVQHVAKVEKAATAISADVGQKLDTRKVEIRTVTQTLTKEVPYAVPSDPTRGSLSVGFVRLHDAAILGVPRVPDPAGRPDAAPSGYADAQLAETDIANAGACLSNAETVIAWQDYWSRQAALYDKTIKAPDTTP
jgi:hypothetical protein